MRQTELVTLVSITTLRSNLFCSDIRYTAFVATVVVYCTLTAFINLTKLNYNENITRMDPIDYVPCIKTSTDLCILEQGALPKMQEEEKVPGNVLVKLCWFSWAPATVLFGPLWRVVFPNDWATEYYRVIKGKGASPHDTHFLILTSHKTMLTFRIQIDRGQHPVDFIQQGSTGPGMVCDRTEGK